MQTMASTLVTLIIGLQMETCWVKADHLSLRRVINTVIDYSFHYIYQKQFFLKKIILTDSFLEERP